MAQKMPATPVWSSPILFKHAQNEVEAYIICLHFGAHMCGNLAVYTRLICASVTHLLRSRLRMSTEPAGKRFKSGKSQEEQSADAVENVAFIQKIQTCRLIAGESISNFTFLKTRTRVIKNRKSFPDKCDGVVYWMSRDQRVQDNWALLYAQKLALEMKVPLHVCFCLVPKFLEATIRQYGFMLKGLKEVEQECASLDIPFHLLIGYAEKVLPAFVEEYNIGGVVVDFSPLRVPLKWVDDVAEKLPKNIAFHQVDAHNIVPCWVASGKLEYGARTIRGKINNQLTTYMTEFPPVIKHPHQQTSQTKLKSVDWEAAFDSLEIDHSVAEADWIKPGTEAGLRNLEEFITKKLKHFNTDRNNPTKSALSNMSPWYHFGQVSAQRAMLMVKEQRTKYKESVDGYLEEGIVRRELSDNFCFYNKNYDSVTGAYDWAKKSLELHKTDKREYIYTRQQLQDAKTHDDLWNAGQIQMIHEGKMHGFLRMYWAKKILEWTESPEQALEFAIYFNDKYQLDGRDPSGYVGCMWSICGIHDQGWAERPVFGKIRFMNYAGCKRKFDVASFVTKYKQKKYSLKK